MANQIYYFRGVAKWAKVHEPDKKFNVYTLDLYLDEPSWAAFKDSGLQLKVRDSEDGEYIKLRRDAERIIAGDVVQIGPPDVYLLKDGEKEKITSLIGNGSQVVCKVVVYDTDRGKGHRLEAMGVENLVEYEGATVMTEEEFPF